MKTLIIYYSRGGTTKRIAEELAKKLGSDVDPITITRDLYKGYLGEWVLHTVIKA